jgi:uncharacterized protein YjiS (DUF1127 family)
MADPMPLILSPEPVEGSKDATLLIQRHRQIRTREKRESSALLELDDRLLRDIGITRAEAIREDRKGFWID